MELESKFIYILENLMENVPSQEETSLGVLDYNAVCDTIEKQSQTKK